MVRDRYLACCFHRSKKTLLKTMDEKLVGKLWPACGSTMTRPQEELAHYHSQSLYLGTLSTGHGNPRERKKIVIYIQWRQQAVHGTLRPGSPAGQRLPDVWCPSAAERKKNLRPRRVKMGGNLFRVPWKRPVRRNLKWGPFGRVYRAVVLKQKELENQRFR